MKYFGYSETAKMVWDKKLRCSFNGKINNEGHKQNAFKRNQLS